jgi:integrase
VQRLTKRLVDSLPATGKLYEKRDAEIIGFSVRVTPVGVRTYCFQWRDQSGRWRRESIGRHGTITCDQARDIAQGWAAIVAAGGEPKPKEPPPELATIETLHARFMAEHAPYTKPRTALNYRGYWTNHILPAWAGRTVISIDRADVQALHLSMRSTPVNANRVFETVRKALNLAETWKMRPIGSNPCREVKKFPERKRKRYLKPSEAQQLGQALREMAREGGLTARYVCLVLLEIYTGARKGEWLNAKWSELDLGRGALILPDTKSNEEQELILPPAALEVLKVVERVADNPYIIAGGKAGKPLQETRRLWARLCKAAGIVPGRKDGLVMHDLRHSFASYTITATGNLAIVGGLLRHADPATTARYAHLLDDPLRAAAHTGSSALSDLINSELPKSNVVNLNRR